MCSMADSNKANIGLSTACLLCMCICRNLGTNCLPARIPGNKRGRKRVGINAFLCYGKIGPSMMELNNVIGRQVCIIKNNIAALISYCE